MKTRSLVVPLLFLAGCATAPLAKTSQPPRSIEEMRADLQKAKLPYTIAGQPKTPEPATCKNMRPQITHRLVKNGFGILQEVYTTPTGKQIAGAPLGLDCISSKHCRFVGCVEIGGIVHIVTPSAVYTYNKVRDALEHADSGGNYQFSVLAGETGLIIAHLVKPDPYGTLEPFGVLYHNGTKWIWRKPELYSLMRVDFRQVEAIERQGNTALLRFDSGKILAMDLQNGEVAQVYTAALPENIKPQTAAAPGSDLSKPITP